MTWAEGYRHFPIHYYLSFSSPMTIKFNQPVVWTFKLQKCLRSYFTMTIVYITRLSRVLPIMMSFVTGASTCMVSKRVQLKHYLILVSGREHFASNRPTLRLSLKTTEHLRVLKKSQSTQAHKLRPSIGLFRSNSVWNCWFLHHKTIRNLYPCAHPARNTELMPPKIAQKS